MSSRRRWPGNDLAFSQAHRDALPDHYGRIGHRLDVADRDWTEFCHHCKTPLAIFEEIRDVGQNVGDKATTITRRLADRAHLPAWLLAWRVERPKSVQSRMDELNQEIRDLEALHPIVGFKVRKLWPVMSKVTLAECSEVWELILMVHRAHHEHCSKAEQNREHDVNSGQLWVAMNNNRLWHPGRGGA